MSPKAYRWVDEMREIGRTFEGEGGWHGGEEGVFGRVAEVYRFVAEGTVLGEERTEERVRGKTAEDVAEAVVEGLEGREKDMGGS
ncbi:hypothetical protein LTS18_005585 [Coniosporium uncinatum]|uniref:Uncharacterized protein n=1 Tax=Coniosporium uncinatum TaxID=93489 RepID=A0ACC3DR91_9PEZI|nr:hypothetical protein LTS18_005585 [Coniosporium uncinatum]